MHEHYLIRICFVPVYMLVKTVSLFTIELCHLAPILRVLPLENLGPRGSLRDDLGVSLLPKFGQHFHSGATVVFDYHRRTVLAALVDMASQRVTSFVRQVEGPYYALVEDTDACIRDKCIFGRLILPDYAIPRIL